MKLKIEGASPTKFISQNTHRDTMDLNDIEGARPMVMKGYGGIK